MPVETALHHSPDLEREERERERERERGGGGGVERGLIYEDTNV